MSLRKAHISFLTLIFSFFVLIIPVFGHGFSKDQNLILNYSSSDSVSGLNRTISQNPPFRLNSSLREKDGGKLINFPIQDRQISPEFDLPVGNGHLVRYHKASRTGASVTNGKKVNYRKASIIGGISAAAISAGFHEAINTWGESKSKFHLKDDWRGDGLAQTDEISHFLWGYKMTQFFYWAYDWVGFSPKTSRTLSLCESSLILTLVEYPIDAYNPQQGLGVSDLIFDYLGVGMAVAKKHSSWLNDFDFKISWKKNVFSENQTLFAQTYEEFDNFIYWLTYRTKLFFPKKLLCFGFGYSATRSGLEAKREFYGGIGLSIPDFASLFGKRVGDKSKFLEILYPNIHMKL